MFRLFSKGGQLEIKSGQSEIAQHLTRTVVLVFGVRLVKGGKGLIIMNMFSSRHESHRTFHHYPS